MELGKIAHTLAATNDVDEDTLRKLHAIVRASNKFDADEVRHINSVIDFGSAVKFQNE